MCLIFYCFPATRFDFVKLMGHCFPCYSVWYCKVNVALHWVAVYISDPIVCYIMTFNLSSHDSGMNTLPKHSWITKKATIINRCLAESSYDDETNCWVWVMKEYNVASWFMLYKIRNSFIWRIKERCYATHQHGWIFLDQNFPLRVTSLQEIIVNRSSETRDFWIRQICLLNMHELSNNLEIKRINNEIKQTKDYKVIWYTL